MIYAFTEAEKKQIESRGMMVVEFKRNLMVIEKVAKVIYYAWDELLRLVDVFAEVAREFCEKFIEAVDNIRLAFNEISEAFGCPISRRYKVVKILSKCTGLEKREIWRMTRRSHLARSCC